MTRTNNEQLGTRFLAPEVLARISSLELIARAVVEGFIAGLHRSPYLGFSTDFAEHRQYMPGDDLRHLDWKLLGRTDRLYIKKYQGDTNSQIHLLVDASASMGYGSGDVTKLQFAQFLSSSLAFLGVRQHDSVGLVAFDERVIEHVPPGSRTGHMRTILGMIERLEPGRGTALADQIHRTAELLTRRSVIVLISDLYEEPDRLIHALEHLRFRGNDVIVFHVLDPQELEFDFAEPVVLEDSETEEQIHVLPDELRDEYLRAIRGHVDSLREGAARNRIDYELLKTTEPLDTALFSYLARRAQLG
ncbi:MAG TPA: DUF58 domain-containing protein [Blastocatellia bacterium]|nr:DUF58 domain-containing protein [Blastocatellia bacterium]